MLQVTPEEVRPPVACRSSLCILATTGVEAEVWIGLESMAELDSFFLFKWPVLEPMGALEDPPLVTSLLDMGGCFKVECFLCPGLGTGFVPWGTLSALEEGLGALKSMGFSALQIVIMWSVKGGPSVGIEKDSLELPKAFFEYQNSDRYSLYWIRDLVEESNLIVGIQYDIFKVEANLFCMSERSRVFSHFIVVVEFVLGLPFYMNRVLMI
ncbi:hypothetical protein Tco_0906464 [Tanacetum coccineum]|uniref:Uncharacterized protein n=1 Tax=Tanacetum coccineum TaxID=301880 RepID=A0ABQ5CMP6_9ASTR